MTPLALWSAVALVALTATAMYAILARRTGVYVTSALAFMTWSWLAIVGGDVGMLNGGDTVFVRQTTASLQFAALALAFISLIVFTMRMLGAYPSPQDNAADAEEEPRRDHTTTSR